VRIRGTALNESEARGVVHGSCRIEMGEVAYEDETVPVCDWIGRRDGDWTVVEFHGACAPATKVRCSNRPLFHGDFKIGRLFIHLATLHRYRVSVVHRESAIIVVVEYDLTSTFIPCSRPGRFVRKV
jgi:hypothetical protein